MHLVHNHLLLDVSASETTARSHSWAVLERGDKIRHVIVGYEDVLTDDGSGWQFAERVLRRVVSY